MIIKIVLFLTLVAFAMIMLADLLLNLSLPGLPEICTQLGVMTLLSAFLLLVTTGLLMLSQRIIQAWKAYFSASQRLQRRLWFIQAKQDRLVRLLYFRAVQVNYFTKLKRKQLLRVNDEQQFKSLSKQIASDLMRIKTQMPSTTYMQLQQEYRHWLALKDMNALLTLQRKIEDFI
jgi:hypothetical protein